MVDLRGTQYHFVVGWCHTGMFKNEYIKSSGYTFLMTLGLSCYAVGRLWANTELEMALKLACTAGRFISAVTKFKKKNRIVAGRMERGPCPLASFVLKFCCSIGKLTRNKCYGRVKRVHQKQMLCDIFLRIKGGQKYL